MSWAWRVMFGAALLVQFWALYTPSPPEGPELGLPVDKVGHFLIFAIVTWLGVRVGVPAGWMAGLMVVQAVASEVVQMAWLGTRSGDVWDFAMDVVGIGAGIVLGRRSVRGNRIG